jgi:hypothetical protein
MRRGRWSIEWEEMHADIFLQSSNESIFDFVIMNAGNLQGAALDFARELLNGPRLSYEKLHTESGNFRTFFRMFFKIRMFFRM